MLFQIGYTPRGGVEADASARLVRPDPVPGSPSPDARTRRRRGPGPAGPAGASGYAVSPDGRAVASVTSADHGDVLELVARNLVTGRRNTIVMATRPDPEANNWPPGVLSLTWAPDDVHLAVQFQLTAACSPSCCSRVVVSCAEQENPPRSRDAF